jgi:hypothetical protein
MLIRCCRDVFTAPLRSNERGADHRKQRFSIVTRVPFRGDVFTEPLPSNEVFGVMTQYYRFTGACCLLHQCRGIHRPQTKWFRTEERGQGRGGGFGINKWQCYVGDGAGWQVGGGKQVAKGEWRWICSWYVCQDVGELEGECFRSSSKWAFFRCLFSLLQIPCTYSTERDSVDRSLWGAVKLQTTTDLLPNGLCHQLNIWGFLLWMLISRFRYWLWGGGARFSVVGWGTLLQAKRSRVRFHEIIGFFNWTNPSSRTMVLRSTQPLTEMSNRNLPGSKRRPAHKADNLTAICEPTVYKMWGASTSHNPMGFHGLLQEEFTFFLPYLSLLKVFLDLPTRAPYLYAVHEHYLPSVSIRPFYLSQCHLI